MKSSHTHPSKDSNIELTLFGIDKQWIRSKDGQWIDKNFSDLEQRDTPLTSQATSSVHWWQFWKKNSVHN